MKVFNIVSAERRDRKPCATLECGEEVRIIIAPWATENDVPVLFLPFMDTRQVPDKWARRWVEERVVPAGRQNLGEVLRANGMESYNAFTLLELSGGRSAGDDFYVEEAVEQVAARTLSADVGALLRATRQSVGMSQEDLAAATGIRQSAISAIERGKANPTIDTLDALAKGMGMSLGVTFSQR